MTYPFEGILNIDKPGGVTSHDVVQQVRRAAGLRRVGHAGTLDPLATGVLLLFLGRATRLVEYVVGQPKTYAATVRLGQTTDTYDADGQVVAERPFSHLTPAEIERSLSRFRGEIRQQPPMYSALKRDGQPLYKLARQGVEVAREARPVMIYELTVEDVSLPHVALTVRCSAGTYIRALAHDLGEALGCGGHVSALRRMAVGDFTVKTAVSLAGLTPENVSKHLLPPDHAVRHWPQIALSADQAAALLHGQTIPRADASPWPDYARAYDPAGVFLGVVSGAADGWQPRKLFPPASKR